MTAPVVSPFTWSAQVTDGPARARRLCAERGRARRLAGGGQGRLRHHGDRRPDAARRRGAERLVRHGGGEPARAGAAAGRQRGDEGRGSGRLRSRRRCRCGRGGAGGIARGPATVDQVHRSDQGEGAAASPTASARTDRAIGVGTVQGGRGKPSGRPETVGALPESRKADRVDGSTYAPRAASQVASAADLRAKACEDRLAGLVTTGQIVFEFASAELDRASFATLDKLAEAAKACPDMRIEVGGHASTEGSAEGNQQLSIRRAQSVVAYLVKAGVDSTQLQPVGYGATRPVAPNDTGENMAKNRRIEFIGSAEVAGRASTAGLGANGLSRLQAVLVAAGCVRDRPGDRLAVLQPEDERPAIGGRPPRPLREAGAVLGVE